MISSSSSSAKVNRRKQSHRSNRRPWNRQAHSPWRRRRRRQKPSEKERKRKKARYRHSHSLRQQTSRDEEEELEEERSWNGHIARGLKPRGSLARSFVKTALLVEEPLTVNMRKTEL
jgi:hypothetical protein